MQLLALGEPRGLGSNLRIKDILQRQESVFYPKDEVRKVIGNDEALTTILRCRCEQCKDIFKMNPGDRKELVRSILSRERPKVILLAILIYLGRGYLIRSLATQGSLHDAALAIDREMISTEAFSEFFRSRHETNAVSYEEKDLFIDNYHAARMLFDPPVFRTADEWTNSYSSDCHFPFLDDEKHGEGSFGEVYKFNIHESCLDVDPDCAKKDWYCNRKKHTFARKILRKKTTNQLDWNLEKTFLRIISLQNHPNIIELLFVYQWREQYIFVFPFLERNLLQVLHSDWKPDGVFNSQTRSLESNWLWKQMVNVADALKTIHDPPVDASDVGYGGPVIGFHFDLKPANILVKEDGTFKVTDFGQALMKSVTQDDLTYGVHRGGSLIYQAPETCPSGSALMLDVSDSRVHRRYDVWSLACIMMEVMVFIKEGGSKAVLAFEGQRQEEPVQGAFYTGADRKALKKCVRRRLENYGAEEFHCNADRVYLSRVLDLLCKMFEINQHGRPSSAIICKELDRFAKGVYSGVASKKQKESWIAKNPISEGIVELCWQSSTGTQSFLDANAVNFQSPKENVAPPIQGYIRLLLNMKTQILRLMQFCSSDCPNNVEFSIPELVYRPLYMYDNETMNLVCSLSNSQSSITMHFASASDLHNFQTAILQSQVLTQPELDADRLRLRSVLLAKSGVKQAERLDYTSIIRLQMIGPARLPILTSYGDSTCLEGNSSERASRIVLFLAASKRCIWIPLSRDKLFTNKGPSRTISIVPNKRAYHDMFRYFDSHVNKDPDRQTSLPVAGHEPRENGSSTKIVLEFMEARDKALFEQTFKANTNQFWV